MTLQVYINGQLVDKEHAKISVFDHGFLFGDGVFEGLRAYNGVIFRLTEHLDRLWESALSIDMDVPISKQEMADAMYQTLQVNQIQDGYIRAIVTRGIGTLGLDADICKNGSVVIIADHLALYPAKLYEEGMAIVTASTIRNSPAALNPRIKSLNYLNNILAKIEGAQAGCAEAMMLNAQGNVAECTGDNIFIVKHGRLLTPGPEEGILSGITRAAVMEIACREGIEVRETTLTRHDVYVADECFLTGSGAELIPVIAVDHRKIGDGKPGPVTKRLHELFHQLTRASRQ